MPRRKTRPRIYAIILFILIPIVGLSDSNRPQPSQDQFVCGTSAEREINARAKGQYYKSKNRGKVFFSPTVQKDVGDVAIVEDDGSILPQSNLFDLTGKSFRFEPT